MINDGIIYQSNGKIKKMLNYFAHRIHKSRIVNGVVCLEFCVLQPDSSGKFDPEAGVKPEEVTFTVNIPLGGFTRSMGVMRAMMVELQEQGILNDGEGGKRKGGPTDGKGRADASNTKKKRRDLTMEEEPNEKLV